MGQTMPMEEFCMSRETTSGCKERLGGVKRAWACWFIKTSPCSRPAVQHTKLQEWGHHEWLSLCDNDCSTQRRGYGQRSPTHPSTPSTPAMDKQQRVCVCGSVCTLRNYSGMWGYMPKKESESHSKEPYSPRLLKKYHSPIKSPGL